MKALLIGGGTVLGIVLGFWPGGLLKAKPAWWRWLVGVTLAATVLLAFGVPTGGDFPSANQVTMTRGDESPVPVLGTVTAIDGDAITLRDVLGNSENISGAARVIAGERVAVGDRVIMELSFSRSGKTFVAASLEYVNPLLTLPLIPGLEERARNLYFHVPSAWLSQLAWFIAFFYAILSIRKRRPEDEIRATAAAAVGALFCVLATVTGAVWARFNWGVFWNWDPRQISIFVVLVIYGAYFALRSALSNDEQRSRLSAAYLVLMLLPVVFFIFVFPRITEGLHPGSQGDGNAGPLLSADPDALNPMKQIIFALSFFSFTLLFFWMMNITARVSMLELRKKQIASPG